MPTGTTDRPAAELLGRLFPGQVEVICRYVDILISRGIERGLLGPLEAPGIWSRHILNCAVIAPAFAVGQSVCDLGSGAGLPGIVLAVARPDLRMTLLEPLLRRSVFLGEVVEELALSNAVVVRGRAEDAAGRVSVHAVTSRAVAPLEKLAHWSWPLLCPGGAVVAIKGQGAAAEIEAARKGLSRIGAGRIRLESYGVGIVDPVTTVVRIESRA